MLRNVLLFTFTMLAVVLTVVSIYETWSGRELLDYKVPTFSTPR